MSEQEEPSHTDQGERLTVSVTPDCHSHAAVINGHPVLVIDYGGYQLVLEAADPGDANEFAVGLAYAALCFGSRCRAQMGRRHA